MLILLRADGGGYGQGQGDQDLSSIINMINNDFFGVAIQYRVSIEFLLSLRLWRVDQVVFGKAWCIRVSVIG